MIELTGAQHVSLIVREAHSDEYLRIGEITAAAFISGGLGESNPYAATLRDAAGRAGDGVLLVATDTGGGQILGATSLVLPGSRLADVCGADEVEFRMLAVDPEAQGCGVGRTLVNECLDRGRHAGARAVVIRVAETSLPARHLYEYLGFTQAPDRDFDLEHGPRLLGYRLVLDVE